MPPIRRSLIPSVTTLELLARLGFAARGIMYLLIGWLALNSRGAASASEMLAMFDSGLGRALLVAMAAGFVGYAGWRFTEAAVDTEGRGTDAKGIAVRAGGVASGILHLVLGFYALRFALGGDDSGGEATQHGAATALDLPGGWLLLVAVAAGLAAAGLFQLVKAIRLDFLKYVDPRCADRAWMRWAGRIGFAARGAVFLIIGWFFWNAASETRASEAGGTGEALASLPQPLGLVAAAGLMMFGVFSFVEARYRRINDPGVLERLRHS